MLISCSQVFDVVLFRIEDSLTFFCSILIEHMYVLCLSMFDIRETEHFRILDVVKTWCWWGSRLHIFEYFGCSWFRDFQIYRCCQARLWWYMLICNVCLLSMFVNLKCSDLSILAKLVFMSNADLVVCWYRGFVTFRASGVSVLPNLNSDETT